MRISTFATPLRLCTDHDSTTTTAPQTAHTHLFFLFSSHIILMSSKSRNSSTPSMTTNSSKLPKFLQSKQSRDRSRSMIDPASNSNSSSTASSSSLLEPPVPVPSSTTQAPKRSIMRRGSKLAGVKEKEKEKEKEASSPPHDADVSEDFSAADDSTDEPPIIVEPLSPRVRMRSERPLSSVSDNHLSYYQSSHSTTRLSDIPTRLSGWFQHAFNSSATDLSLPNLINSGNLPPSGSPKTKSALLAAAKHGKGQFDKAMRYILDSDATPDRCTDPIWLLGLQHPGYDPSTEPPPALSRRGSVDSRRASTFRTSTSSTVSASPGGGNAPSPSPSKNNAVHWSPEFYADFTSCVWITYRSHFQPIRDSSLTVLEREQAEVAAAAAAGSAIPISSSPPSKRWWPGGEKGWTSDTGWGCMLRTGQSLLATALIHLHLGRGLCPFDFPSASLTLSRLAATSPPHIYCRLFNIRPDFNLVLGLAIPALSVQRTPYGSSREGAW
jgi:cysteine protease ATG4